MHFQGIITTIKERRSVLGITQEELAELSGVALRSVKAFESGKGNPTLLTLQKIADTLGYEVTLTIKKLPKP